MLEHIVYRGRVATRKAKYGFIDIKTVTKQNGGSHILSTEKDIYVHFNDVPEAATEDEVHFVVKIDEKRRGGYRAYKPKPLPLPLELHFDTRVINHPVVPVRWCLTQELGEKVQRCTDTKRWYLAFVLQPRRDEPILHTTGRYGTVFQYEFGLERIALGHGFIEFPGPGEYDVTAYLVSSNLKPQHLEKLLRGVGADDVRRIDVWEDWEEQVLSFDQNGLHFLSLGYRSDSPDLVEGYAYLTVSVPDGIFAPPLSDSQMRWLRYFNLHRFHDQCDTRGRLFFVNTAGRVIYLFWETLKRTWMLIVGLAHLALFGGSPLPVWRQAVTRDLSAGMSNWKGEDEFKPIREWQGWWWVTHPFPYVWYGTCALLWHLWPESSIPLYVALTPVVLFLGTVLLAGGALSYDSARNRLAEKKQLEIAKRLNTYAVCADTLPAAPRPVSIRLLWNGLKQAVCRPYRRPY